MGEVVDFPGFDERTWREMEDAFSAGLRQCGVSADGTRWIITEWKQRMMEALPSLEVHIAVPHPVDVTPRERQIAETVGNAVMSRWRELLQDVVFQLLMVVIDLYYALQPGNPPTASKQMTADILKFIRARKPAENDDRDTMT